MSKYILKSKKYLLTSYALFVADSISDILLGEVKWGLSITDDVQDATKFSFISDIFTLMEDTGLGKDDWEVEVLEE